MSTTKDDLCMCDLCRKRAVAYARIAAFDAIRSALGVARDLERGGWHKMEADAIRWAIRAALKQEKP